MAETPQTQVYLAPWCTEEDLPERRLKNVTDFDQAEMICAATDLLYVLSGRQFRSGRSIVRPTSIQAGYGNQSYLYPYSSMSGYGAAWGFAGGWAWSAMGMGWWQQGQDLSECVLQGPVRRINDVLVDGASLGSWPPVNPNFTLYDRRRLVRNVGSVGNNSGAWPWNQSLQMPTNQPGTWLIDYEWGKPCPPMGKMACIELTTNLLLAMSGTDSNALPQRVVSVAMEGVSMQVGDPLTFIRESLTGLPVVDMFLQQANPGGLLRRKSVFLGPNSILNRSQTTFPS